MSSSSSTLAPGTEGKTYFDLHTYAPFEEVIKECRRIGAVTPASFGRAEVFHVCVHHGGVAALRPSGLRRNTTEAELRFYWQAHLL